MKDIKNNKNYVQYKVINKVHHNNQFCGYKLVDLWQNSYVYIGRNQFKELVEVGKIKDCKCSGEDVTGINGFRLRELPIEDIDVGIEAVALLYLGNMQQPIGYILENKTNQEIKYNNKIIDKNCLFIVPLFDISLFVKELKGYNALHSRNMNSIGVLEIQPITKLKPSIDNISITVYNSTTNTYYVRLPYLYNKELKEYIDGIVENKNIKLIMNVVKNDIISEETLLAKEMSLWNTSMRLYHNNIYDAMEDNRHFEDCEMLDDAEDDEKWNEESKSFESSNKIKGFKDLVGSIFKK